MWTAIGLLILVVGCLAASLLRSRKQHVADTTKHPRIARMKVHHIRCRGCEKPLGDGQAVVWLEAANGDRTDVMHEECGVILRNPDGSLTTLDGASVVAAVLPLSAIMVIDAAEWPTWRQASGV